MNIKSIIWLFSLLVVTALSSPLKKSKDNKDNLTTRSTTNSKDKDEDKTNATSLCQVGLDT